MSLSGFQSFSHAQREVLMEHVDGSAPVRANDFHRGQTVSCLVRRELLAYHDGPGWQSARPTHSFLTAKGREVLIALLADYADVLARARGLLPPDPPVARKPHDDHPSIQAQI